MNDCELCRDGVGLQDFDRILDYTDRENMVICIKHAVSMQEAYREKRERPVKYAPNRPLFAQQLTVLYGR